MKFMNHLFSFQQHIRREHNNEPNLYTCKENGCKYNCKTKNDVFYHLKYFHFYSESLSSYIVSNIKEVSLDFDGEKIELENEGKTNYFIIFISLAINKQLYDI